MYRNRHPGRGRADGLPLLNRDQAGHDLGQALAGYRSSPNLIVLALPRGGVPVAVRVAGALDAPLDLMLVRKLGVPGQRELAMGAVAGGGIEVLNEDLVRDLRISRDVIDRVAAAERQELERRALAYRDDRPWPELKHRTVILVDDGLATGASMFAAIKAARAQHPARIVVAVPVAPADTIRKLRGEVDDVAYLAAPEPFHAIGQWYADFSQVSDNDVRALLAQAWADQSSRKEPVA